MVIDTSGNQIDRRSESVHITGEVKVDIFHWGNVRPASARCAALDAKDRELGFREAHTLKGVSANLALAPLTRSSSMLTEKLRGEGEFGDDINSLYLDVKRDYERIVELIKLLS